MVEFVTETLLLILNTFNGTNAQSVVVMDNCAIHHAYVGPFVHQIETVAQAKRLQILMILVLLTNPTSNSLCMISPRS